MVDIIIIGGGIAGMTAALYSLRSGKSVLIIEKENFGGQIANSPKVENFPTIKEISGIELSDRLFEQISALGVQIELDTISDVTKNNDCFDCVGEYNTYHSKAVIIASGVHHRKIGVEREDELVGKGISYCAVCDGAFYKGEDVALIGDANTALQYTLLLSNYCKHVYLCTLFDKFFAEDALVKAMNQRENVIVTHNLSLEKFVGENELTGLDFKDTKTEEIKHFDCKACFIAIGQIPSNEAFKNVCDLDKAGYIISDETCLTKTKGVFVAGDCRTKKIRQLTTAVSDGATAAIAAVSYIDQL